LSLLRELFRPFPKKLATVPAGRLLVFGALAKGDRAFSPEDLAGLDAAFQTPDVGRYKAGFHGRAVRMAGLLQACAPKSGPLYLNAGSRDGSKVIAYWLSELEPLAWVVYGDGAFQLVVPGADAPRASIPDLALIEIANQGETERGV
jgi:hypothetical protein